MLRHIKWQTVLRTAISFLLLAWFAHSVKWQNIGGMLAQASYPWLLAAVAVIILAVIVSVQKWRIILLAQGIKLDWWELWRIYWAGLFFNNFLPSSMGGDALRIYWTGKSAGDSAGAAASVIIERVLATTGLALVGLAGCLFVHTPGAGIVGLFALLTILSLALLGIMTWGFVPKRVKKRDNRFSRFIKGLANSGSRIGKQPRQVIKVIIWSAIFQLCVVLVNYLIMQGLGIGNIRLMQALYIVPAVSVAAMLPIGINGYGLREGAYITLLAAYGVSSAAAFTASVTFALLVSLCSLWGGWIWLRNKSATAVKPAGMEISEEYGA